MGSLYLVRHGQASFGADDYDNLSELGQRQCRRLGEYLRARGSRFDAVYTGTLKRHAQSLAAIVEGYGETLPMPDSRPGLDEYDSHAVIATVHPDPLEKATTPETYRAHFRLLRDGLRLWMAGRAQPAGMPSYADFVAGIEHTLDEIRQGAHERVLIVSSGGPISTAVGRVLSTPAETTIELNLHIRNSALTEFRWNPKRHTLVTYNTLPHLDDPALADWITYA